MKDISPFELSEKENRDALATIATVFGWLSMLALIIATGIHAVSLVLDNVDRGSGVIYAIRVSSPVLTEIFAGLTAVGFAVHVWRGGQKLVGTAIEVVWFAFAALNLITSFNLETGGALSPSLYNWLHYGLPVSMLFTGGLFYAMYRIDPVHKRKAELKAAKEKEAMADFKARRSVRESPEMEAVREQRAWLEEVKRLEAEHYTPAQIEFMVEAVPELQKLVRERYGKATDTQVANSRITASQSPVPLPTQVEERPYVYTGDKHVSSTKPNGRSGLSLDGGEDFPHPRR